MKGNVEFSDKDLHCIARKIQSELLESEETCLYCKYAVDCSKRIEGYYRINVMDKVMQLLQEKTGVFLRWWLNKKIATKKLLNGSWIEQCPELMEKFVGKSFEEQVEMLESEEIWEYIKKMEGEKENEGRL